MQKTPFYSGRPRRAVHLGRQESSTVLVNRAEWEEFRAGRRAGSQGRAQGRDQGQNQGGA
eukprot:CAMPEP_0175730244 /NCGR_PEP_ID=MMETSP0097-20121207/50223_1 /TAXON_ID=311494 /ORGANISM="Alexandrium monilatum, Strain CCMP3105" /LENGTH=59 /DNA_ID=CAMNT_0017038139 /DNA_START=79 /DNA_END=254 /DNA_ORIENTATION=+